MLDLGINGALAVCVCMILSIVFTTIDDNNQVCRAFPSGVDDARAFKHVEVLLVGSWLSLVYAPEFEGFRGLKSTKPLALPRNYSCLPYEPPPTRAPPNLTANTSI